MQRQQLAATIELVVGLGMLACFVALLAVPALIGALQEIPWLVRAPPRLPLPSFGLNPHLVAGAPYAPSLLVLMACATLAACFRWWLTRRRE